MIDDFNLLFEGLTFQESINQSEFFKTFLTEYTKETLIFELKQRIGEQLDFDKQSLGEVTYKPNQTKK